MLLHNQDWNRYVGYQPIELVIAGDAAVYGTICTDRTIGLQWRDGSDPNQPFVRVENNGCVYGVNMSNRGEGWMELVNRGTMYSVTLQAQDGVDAYDTFTL